MKKVIFCLILLSAIESRAQTKQYSENSDLQLKEANRYLRGEGKPYDPGKAFAINMSYATEGNPKAMSAIASQYITGIGVKKDHSEGIKWLNKAADLGHVPAFISLGNIYSSGNGLNIDYNKAFEYFKKAADLGSITGKYRQAYCYFKGIGCVQNYYKSYELFKALSENGHFPSQYYLGLCLRNGYGVPRNLSTAEEWLQKSWKAGSLQAKEELDQPEPERPNIPKAAPGLLNKVILLNQKIQYSAGNGYLRIKHNIKEDELSGEYNGFVIRYDWSGKYITDISPLSFHIDCKGELVTGNWNEGSVHVGLITGELSDSSLVFKNSKLRLINHYSGPKGEVWFLKQARMQVVGSGDSLFLSGNLELFSETRKEPAKPILFVASKFSKSKYVEIQANHASVFPNPFKESTTIQFSLEESQDLSIWITSIDGKILFSEKLEGLTVGTYQKALKLPFAKGVYILNVSGKSISKKFKIIKD